MDSEAIAAALRSFELSTGTEPGDVPIAHLEQRVIAITRSIFTEPFEIEAFSDPGETGTRWRVVSLRAAGSYAELLARQKSWHRAIRAGLGDNAWRYTISLHPMCDDGSVPADC